MLPFEELRYPACLLAVVCLIVYLLTLCPSVPGGDSGELISAAHNCAVAHPPGFPIYTLVAKLFTFVPIGSIAWRVNLFSAVCQTCAGVLLFLAAAQWSGSVAGGLVAGGLFCFSPIVWRYAVVAEVFALNNAFVALLLLLCLRYARGRQRRTAYLGAFVIGLGLSNHHILVFIGVPLACWVLWFGRDDLCQGKPLLFLSLAFAAGLLPYLYLPIASHLGHPHTWGDQATLKGFLHHFFRGDYGTFELGNPQAPGGSQLGPGLVRYLDRLPRETLFVGFYLAVFGLWRTLRRERLQGLAFASFAAFSFYMVVFHALANLPLDEPFYYETHIRFWQQANVLVLAWCGLGYACVARRYLRPIWHGLPLCVAVALVAFQVSSHFEEENQSGNRLFHTFGVSALESLPEGSLLITRGDLWNNILRYVQQCEGVRRDVCLLDLELLKGAWSKPLVTRYYPNIVIPGEAYGPSDAAPYPGNYSLEDLVRANILDLPVSMCRLRRGEPLRWPGAYETRPYGLVFRVLPEGTSLDVQTYLEEHNRALGRFTSAWFEDQVKRGKWERIIANYYCAAQDHAAEVVVRHAKQHGNPPKLLWVAAEIVEDLVQVHPQPDPVTLKNLGIIYFRLSDTDSSVRPRMVDAWRRFLAEAAPGDPDREKIREIVYGTGS